MQSDATTVESYLESLPPERRAAVSAVRDALRAALPAGLQETMQHGMIAYVVPLERFPDTYNGQPLLHTALASQKNHLSLYLMGIYADEGLREQFETAYRATGKKFDVGKSCVRFRSLEDLPLDVVTDAAAAMSVERLCAAHEGQRSLRTARRVP